MGGDTVSVSASGTTPVSIEATGNISLTTDPGTTEDPLSAIKVANGGNLTLSVGNDLTLDGPQNFNAPTIDVRGTTKTTAVVTAGNSATISYFGQNNTIEVFNGGQLTLTSPLTTIDAQKAASGIFAQQLQPNLPTKVNLSVKSLAINSAGSKGDIYALGGLREMLI